MVNFFSSLNNTSRLCNVAQWLKCNRKANHRKITMEKFERNFWGQWMLLRGCQRASTNEHSCTHAYSKAPYLCIRYCVDTNIYAHIFTINISSRLNQHPPSKLMNMLSSPVLWTDSLPISGISTHTEIYRGSHVKIIKNTSINVTKNSSTFSTANTVLNTKMPET